MKKYAKILQADARGQIVIPKDIRRELGITEGSGFYAYVIGKEGIFLKRLPDTELKDHNEIQELKDNAKKIHVDKKAVEQAEKEYTKKSEGGFETI